MKKENLAANVDNLKRFSNEELNILSNKNKSILEDMKNTGKSAIEIIEKTHEFAILEAGKEKDAVIKEAGLVLANAKIIAAQIFKLQQEKAPGTVPNSVLQDQNLAATKNRFSKIA